MSKNERSWSAVADVYEIPLFAVSTYLRHNNSVEQQALLVGVILKCMWGQWISCFFSTFCGKAHEGHSLLAEFTEGQELA